MKKLVALSFALLVALPAIAAAGDDEAAPGYLGVRLQRVEGGLAEALGLEEDTGVLVGQVESDSPAEAAGLRAGDILVALDGKAVGRPGEVSSAVRDLSAGDEVKIEYLRDGKKATATAVLAEAESRRMPRNIEVRELKFGKDRGYLGVSAQPLSEDLAAYFGAAKGGALVSEVMEDSPAAKLGLKAGDVITAVDGDEIQDPGDLQETIGEIDEAREVEVVWIRDKKEKSGKVELEVREGLAWHHPGRWMGHGMDPGVMRWFGDEGDGHRVLIERQLEGTEDLQEQMDELRQELDELKKELEKE
jgi:S1-C subfamily serine protease